MINFYFLFKNKNMNSQILEQGEKDQIQKQIQQNQTRIDELDKEKSNLKQQITQLNKRLTIILNNEKIHLLVQNELKIPGKMTFNAYFLERKFVIQYNNIKSFQISPDSQKIAFFNSDYENNTDLLIIYDLNSEKEIQRYPFNKDQQIYNILWWTDYKIVIEMDTDIFMYNCTDNSINKLLSVGEQYLLLDIVHNYIAYRLINNNKNWLYLYNLTTFEQKIIKNIYKPDKIFAFSKNQISILSHFERTISIWDLNLMICFYEKELEYSIGLKIVPFNTKSEFLGINAKESGDKITKLDLELEHTLVNDIFLSKNDKILIYIFKSQLHFYNFETNEIYHLHDEENEYKITDVQISKDNKFIIIKNEQTTTLEVWLFGRNDPKSVRRV